MKADGEARGSKPKRPLDILVVEDDRDTLCTLSILLHHYGHRVQEANDGATALSLIEQSPPDVVLLDIGLPKMNGFDVCRRIRQNSDGKPPFIIAISGYAEPCYRNQAAQAGVDLYLIKPVEFPQLEKILERFHRIVMPGAERVTTADQKSSSLQMSSDRALLRQAEAHFQHVLAQYEARSQRMHQFLERAKTMEAKFLGIADRNARINERLAAIKQRLERARFRHRS